MMSARDTPPSSATIAEGNALVIVVRKAHEKSNISRDVGSEHARDMLKLETRMEGVARGRGALLSVAEGGSNASGGGKRKKGWEKVRKGHLESSRKRLPLLGGRRYVASSPSGVGATWGEGDTALGQGERREQGRTG